MKKMTDYELLKYAMMTTALTAMCVLIHDVLNWLCQKADEEYKENKKNEENKKNKENEENKENKKKSTARMRRISRRTRNQSNIS